MDEKVMIIQDEEQDEKNDVVLIQLDRPYMLRLGNKALKEYSALTKTTMRDFDSSLMDFANQQAAAYILIKQDCVRQGLPVPTPGQVEDLLDRYVTPGRLFYLLSRAAEAAFADEELMAQANAKRSGEQKSEDPPPAAGTGERA